MPPLDLIIVIVSGVVIIDVVWELFKRYCR